MKFKVLTALCASAILLNSCGTTQTTRSAAPAKAVEPAKTQTKKDSAYYLEQARALDQSRTEQRNDLLLKAIEQANSDNRPYHAIALADRTLPTLVAEHQIHYGHLLLAEAYVNIAPNHPIIQALTEKIDPSYVPNSRLIRIQYAAHVQQQNWLAAAVMLKKLNINDQAHTENIWSAVTKLSEPELIEARWQHPELLPWIQLALVIKQHAADYQALQQNTAQWQNAHRNHSLNQFFPASVQKALETQPIDAKQIAVLLPLSGRLESQGQAIKDGLLSAYLAQPTAVKNQQNLRFFDSNQDDITSLAEQVIDAELIIGPLLKDKISALQQHLSSQQVHVALNRLEQNQDVATPEENAIETGFNAERYYFSLAPEDEAKQLAEHVLQQGMTNTLVFADDTNLTKRLADTFSNHWQTQSSSPAPKQHIVQSSKDMRNSVAAMLDVKQSEDRIEQIERLADVEVIGKQRNRRDVDAIVLFANPEQTGLLNPIIEASLSAFAEMSLSVFASSYSYTQNQTDSSRRDLRGLTFVDMPWLIDPQAKPKLRKQSQQLWPEQTDTLARLFALGFDAYQVLPNLRTLQHLPNASIQGLTGEIQVDASGVINRQLKLAQITDAEVKLVELD